MSYFPDIVTIEGIDKNRYTVLEPMGFDSKKDAYDCIQKWWSDIKNATVVLNAGQYYVVQSKTVR